MSTWSLVYTSSHAEPDHRQRGRDRNLFDGDSRQRKADTRILYLKVDLLRGKPSPRGPEF